MERKLIEFSDSLRAAGIPISQAEFIDASSALLCLRLDNRSTVKDGLRAAFVKRARDIPVFDTLFDLHFGADVASLDLPDAEEEQALIEIRRLIAERVQTRGSRLSPVTELVVSGRSGELVRMIMSMSQGMGIQQAAGAPLRGAFFLNTLRKQLRLDRIKEEVEEQLADPQDRGSQSKVPGIVRDYLDRSRERIDRGLAAIVQSQVALTRFMALRRIEQEENLERNLFNLDEDELTAMRPLVERLARELKDRLSMRMRRRQTGRFDLKSTLRKNVGFGGALPYLRFRDKKAAKPQVAVLCDVSRSVRTFSRFMLLFVYALKEVVPNLRSFTFVGDLAEVTPLFEQYDLNEATSMAASGYGLRYPFGTDYGSSFTQFVEEYLSAVSSRTTVIVLGDARNNNLPSRQEALEAVAEKAKKVIWLNPEPRSTWDLGDSIMGVYRCHCTTVAECGTIRQLAGVIEGSIAPACRPRTIDRERTKLPLSHLGSVSSDRGL